MLKSFVSALIGGRRILFLYLCLALIGSIASARVGAEVRLWRANDSGHVASSVEQLPWTGQSLAGSNVHRLSGEEDPGDRTWISPIAEGPTAFSPSLEGTMLEVSRAASSPPSLEEFRRSVMNGRPDQLSGIWVEDVLAFRVQQGLTSQAPAVKDTLSIYNWAWKNGVVGLLIHNYRGGTQLYQLNPGVQIAANYGNGGVDWYLSRGDTWYESRRSSSAGPFRIWSCEDCAFDVSSRDLRKRHYAGNHRLAFQTCVTAEGRTGLVIIEAYLDRPPEPLPTDGEFLGNWERDYPRMPKQY